MPVLTGSAAYGVSEAFGWRSGLDSKPRRTPQFYLVIVAATLGEDHARHRVPQGVLEFEPCGALTVSERAPPDADLFPTSWLACQKKRYGDMVVPRSATRIPM